MERRSLLQVLGVGGAASVAGCGDSSSVEPNSEPQQTEQTDDGVSIDGLSDEQLHEAYLSDSLAEYGVTGWARKEEVRVYDGSVDDLTFVEPDNEWFLQARIAFYNAGGETLQPPDEDSFTLYHNGSEYTRITALPSDEFGFDDIREYFGVTLDPGSNYVPDSFDPTAYGMVELLFDVESEPIDWAINVTGALDSQPEQDQYVYYAE